MNIVEFCLSPDLGGLELFMVDCYNYFQTKTNCFIIINKNTKLDTYIDGDKFYIKRNKLFPIIPAIKLANFIDNNNIDIIHFHWTKDIATVVLAKKIAKRDVKIIQTRNMTMTRFKDDFYHKFLYRNITCMHAVTNQVKEQLYKFIPSSIRPKIETIYMGTNIPNDFNKDKKLQQKYNLKDNDFVVGIVGRIEKGKGQYIVIESLSKLNIDNIKLLIVGHTMDNKYLSYLKSMVKELNLENQVIFTGFTKQVNKHFSLMDVNILATPKETFGLVIIEAMSNKVAVIATNNGGPLEIITNGENGLLFKRDSDDLAKKIKLLYTNKELLKNISENGYKLVNKKFNKNNQLNKLYNFITQC